MKTKFIYIITSIIAVFILSSFVFQETSATKPFVVVLDAGHGGKDPGKVSKKGYKEKDVALKIVLQIGKLLEKQPNIKIIYTRKTDVFIKLTERAKIANRADADLFVSIHCNAHHSQALGAETYVLGLHRNQANFEVAKKENEVIFLEDNYEENYAGFDPSSPESLIGMTLMQEEYLDQSILLASLIQNNFKNNLKRTDRSVKQAGFVVLYKSYMPSVLIETGFLTHTKEGTYLNSKKGQSEIAREIAAGITSYRNSLLLATQDSQNPIITQEEIDEVIDKADERIFNTIIFKVQLSAVSRKISTKPYNFNGLKEITRIKEGKFYKYYYGETSDYNKIQLMKKFAKEKGFDTCFIVAYKGDKKIKVSEVLNSNGK